MRTRKNGTLLTVILTALAQGAATLGTKITDLIIWWDHQTLNKPHRNPAEPPGAGAFQLPAQAETRLPSTTAAIIWQGAQIIRSGGISTVSPIAERPHRTSRPRAS